MGRQGDFSGLCLCTRSFVAGDRRLWLVVLAPKPVSRVAGNGKREGLKSTLYGHSKAWRLNVGYQGNPAG